MKHLIAMRHARAAPAERDVARPLSRSGRRDARRMGPALADLGGPFAPSTVLCSASLRTRETWAELAPALAPGIVAVFREDLYLASAGQLAAALQELGDPGCALVLAHEPGLSQLLRRLAGRARPRARVGAARGMGTACFAALALEIPSWDRLDAGCGELVAFRCPADLPLEPGDTPVPG